MKLIASLSFVSLICFSNFAFSFDGEQSADVERKVSRQINWTILNDFGDFYSSFALQTSTLKRQKEVPPFYLGDKYGQLGVEVLAEQDNTILKVRAKLGDLIETQDETFVLAKKGKYKVYPNFLYNYDRILQESGPRIERLTIDVDMNGVTDRKNDTLRVLGVNNVLLAWKHGNRWIPNNYAFAQYVNENHPAIDKILRAALDLPVPPVKDFVGYQHGKDKVYKQVFALWYLLQRSGVTYSSILTPEVVSEFSASQSVRPFGEVLRSRQANCIDGTVFFASVLRKIGIDTVIVSRPGHAYLGFYTEEGNKRSLDFLETTWLGSDRSIYANSSLEGLKIEMAKIFQVDQKMQKSINLFNAAINEGRRKYNQDKRGIEMKSSGFQIVDIEEARKAGITPLNL